MNVRKCLIVLACIASWGLRPADAALFQKPGGPLLQRTLDQAAEDAVNKWIESLSAAPRFETVENVGILNLSRDSREFTEILSDALSRNPRLRVVVLRGPAWDAIEDEMARQDPEEGWGDIMDKAAIAWDNTRGEYSLPESTLPANALLMGQVRSIDTDNWLIPRVQLNLRLVTVKTREVVAGGFVTGEATISWRDLAIYYKMEIFIIAAALFILWRMRRFMAGMQRPR